MTLKVIWHTATCTIYSDCPMFKDNFYIEARLLPLRLFCYFLVASEISESKLVSP